LELALSSDIIFASENAQFGATEIKLGWVGGGGVSAMLTHLIGYGRAMKMILSGEMISADKAYEYGLVEEVVPLEDLKSYTYEFAEKLVAYSPITLQTAKHNCRMALSVP